MKHCFHPCHPEEDQSKVQVKEEINLEQDHHRYSVQQIVVSQYQIAFIDESIESCSFMKIELVDTLFIEE